MQKLSKKDKKMMIVLAVFLIGMAYYEFLLVPLSNMNDIAQKSLVDKRKELLLVKTKLGGLANYRKKIKDLNKVICFTMNKNNMPYIDEKLNNKMKAVMSAADNASVKVLSLKPINDVAENEDGTVKTIKDKFIAIDGNADLNSFLIFLNNLWGVELYELQVSSISENGSRLRFYIKILFLPKTELDIKPNNNEVIDIKFGVKNNIFKKIVPPPPPPPPKPPGWKPPPPPKPVRKLDNAKLLGIAEFGNNKMAIIEDNQKRITDFFFIGSKFRDSKLWKVDGTSAIFLFSDGQTVTLKLPKEKKYYNVSDNNREKKKGHLGILAETFTEQLSKQYDLKFEPGLLVISSGAHGDVLQKGDVITSINGKSTPNFEAALGVMKTVYAGDDLKISLLRHGVNKNITYKAD